jgi:structure-specific endonuclease subunit SLX1
MDTWGVYCLSTLQEPIHTYIGATPDPERRLRQHNGEQSGGAKATSQRAGDWYRVCFVKGFQDKCDALSFEWHWKHFTKKEKHVKDSLERRKRALETCMKWYSVKQNRELDVDWS